MLSGFENFYCEEGKKMEAGETETKLHPLANAWIFLDEDQPTNTDYDSPNSCYQRLIEKKVYPCIDMLFVCFFRVKKTGTDTVPDGNGSSWTIKIRDGQHLPSNLTNENYLKKVVMDARKANSKIKILATLDWGQENELSQIVSNPATAQDDAGIFARNLVQYLEFYGMDGFDIDWESPLSSGTSSAQFACLVNAIGSTFRKQAKKYYLTFSPAYRDNLEKDAIGVINTSVDFINFQLYFNKRLPQEFSDVDPKLFAYGAKFEANAGGAKPGDKGYETAEDAFEKNASHYHYPIFTNWRLNSENYVFEQEEQKKLHRLVHNGQRNNRKGSGNQ